MAGTILVRAFAHRRSVLVSICFSITVSFLVLGIGDSDASPSVTVRGAYGRDSSSSGVDTISSAGFNTVTYNGWAGRAGLDALAAKGIQAIIWLGEYDRTASCQFEFSDDWIRGVVESIAGHPAIVAYQLSDEPNYARLHCPNAVDDHKRRAALIRSIDPTNPTYVTISTWDGQEGFPYQYFAGAADIMGLVVYPCYPTTGDCKFGIIDSAISEADKDGVARYWAVTQDFYDAWYRLPTPDELRQQFNSWMKSRMEGYVVYHWNIGDIETRPGVLDVYRQQNEFFASETSPSPTPTPTVTLSQTPAPVDSTPPTAPGALGVKWVKRTAQLSWRASTDNVGVAGYRIWRDGTLVGTTTSLSFYDRPLVKIAHTYSVRAFDGAGNLSSTSTAILDKIRR